MLALAAILQLTLTQPGLPVLRVSPGPATPCPDLAAFTEAVRTRSPSVSIEEGGTLQPNDLAVSISSQPASWRLEVRRAGGALAMARDLDTVGFGCEELADTAALMIDRLLEQLDWNGQPVEMEPLRATAVARALPSPPPPLLTGLELSAGGSARAGLSVALSPGASIELAARFGAWRVAGWVHGGASRSEDVWVNGHQLGTFWSQSFVGALAIERCRPAGPLEACGGPLVGGELTLAGASGQYLYRQTRQTLWTALAGGEGRLGYPLGPALELSADLAVAARLGGGKVAVEVAVEEVDVGYSPPSVGAVASLRLGWRFF